jgi:hypothetical protein
MTQWRDEPVVSETGDLCTIKDCCVVICESDTPAANPPRVYTDQAKLTAAYSAVRGAVEQVHDWTFAEAVHRTLVKLPVRYNARLTRAIGRAKFKNVPERGGVVATEIELTAAYEIPESYMHRLLVHEGCHVARSVIEPARFNYENPHGMNWSALMVAAGEEARATCIDPQIEAQRRKRIGHPEIGAMAREGVNVGDRVSFIAGKKRGRVVAQVIQKTEKGAIVRNDDGERWRVGYGLLTKETTT